MLLLANEGITADIRSAFVVYLVSHDRPMNELLDPTRLDLRRIFENEFLGMTTMDVTLDQLEAARETYVATLLRDLTSAERHFLLSVKMGMPDWSLFPVAGIDRLPAVQWKLRNIARMSKSKHADAVAKLRAVLGL